MNDLTSLHIRNNMISKRGFIMLFNALPKLEELDLSNSSSDSFLDVAV